MLDLSVVIPAYNEQSRLLLTLQSVHDFLLKSMLDFEIIVVNDGSKDATIQIVQEFASHNQKVRLITYDRNKGKGHAVRAGVLASYGNLILMNDADGSSPIEEIGRLQAAIVQGADIAIGSRAKPDSECHIEALSYRKYIGRIFGSIVQMLVLPGIYDTQCGFKLFKKSAAKNVFSLARVNGYAFDVEILYIAKQKNYIIEEVAINWANVDGSKINLLLDPLKMLYEILKIKINDQLGLYKPKSEAQTND